MTLTTDGKSYERLPPVTRELMFKGDSPPVEPDVAVDIISTDSQQITRIPTTEVELEETKDGPAAITRTARVEFPAEWGGEDILQHINGYQSLKASVETDDEEEIDPETVDPEDVYDICRIFFRDQITGQWVVKHFGYIGGVGPATNSGTFKFYVYDPADLLRGISVSTSFNEVNAVDVLMFVLDGTDDRGEPVGMRKRTVFNDANPEIVKDSDEQLVAEKAGLVSAFEETIEDLEVSDQGDVANPLLTNPTGTFDNFAEIITGSRNEETGEIVRSAFSGAKNFKSNRHNLVDVLNWFTNQIGAQWFFEPWLNIPTLVIDATDDGPPRREFTDTEIADEAESYTGGEFAEINVLDNTAIADIKPINRVTVNGESLNRRPQGNTVVNLKKYTSKYPTATAIYKPLLKRAGGYRHGPTDVNANVQTIGSAEAKAVDELRQHLSEATDGDVKITGDPFTKPYDYLTIIPVCNDTFPNADAEPITFEINKTRHTKSATDRYITECDVSFVFDESKVSITSTRKDL